MRPTILYEGKEYPVKSITWCQDGGISDATFTDNDGIFHVANRKYSFDKEGYNDSGNLHLDLEKRVKWGELSATS